MGDRASQTLFGSFDVRSYQFRLQRSENFSIFTFGLTPKDKSLVEKMTAYSLIVQRHIQVNPLSSESNLMALAFTEQRERPKEVHFALEIVTR